MEPHLSRSTCAIIWNNYRKHSYEERVSTMRGILIDDAEYYRLMSIGWIKIEDYVPIRCQSGRILACGRSKVTAVLTAAEREVGTQKYEARKARNIEEKVRRQMCVDKLRADIRELRGL